jgi:hypothetical protein
MDDAATDLPPLADDDADDGARPLAERQLQMLGELAKIGLACARYVESQTRAEPPPPAAEIALAYARVSRPVRQAILLQSRLIAERKAAEAAPAAAPPAAPEPGAAPSEFRYTPIEARKARVARIVERLAEADHPEDEAAIDELMGEALDRLDDDDRYGDLLDRPVSEIVARICADLGLSPDWTRLAQEPWAQAEIAAGAAGAPLAPYLPQAPHLPREAAGGGPPAERSEEPGVEGASRERFAQSSAFWDSFLPERDSHSQADSS